jgi:hypothetical protein
VATPEAIARTEELEIRVARLEARNHALFRCMTEATEAAGLPSRQFMEAAEARDGRRPATPAEHINSDRRTTNVRKLGGHRVHRVLLYCPTRKAPRTPWAGCSVTSRAPATRWPRSATTSGTDMQSIWQTDSSGGGGQLVLALVATLGTAAGRRASPGSCGRASAFFTHHCCSSTCGRGRRSCGPRRLPPAPWPPKGAARIVRPPLAN